MNIYKSQLKIVDAAKISNSVAHVLFFSSSLYGVHIDLLHFPAMFGMFVVDFEGNRK